jgi:hypothetical protein
MFDLYQEETKCNIPLHVVFTVPAESLRNVSGGQCKNQPARIDRELNGKSNVPCLPPVFVSSPTRYRMMCQGRRLTYPLRKTRTKNLS